MDAHGGNIWKRIRKKEAQRTGILDFSASINPLGFPRIIKRAIQRDVGNLVHYPDPEYVSLRHDIARYIGVNTREILAGNGSTELISLLVRAIKPSRVLIPVPFFSEYARAASVNGSTVSFLNTKKGDAFFLDTEKLLRSLKNIEMLFLGNPNSPAGYIIGRDNILKIADACSKKDIWLVIDEVFIEFAEKGKLLTLAEDAVKRKRLIVIRSATKFFGVPGMRLGYLISKRETVEKLRRIQEPWSVNGFAALSFGPCFQDRNFIERSCRHIKKEREFLFKELKKLKNIHLFPTYANFFLAEIKSLKVDSMTLAQKMEKEGVLIRDCKNIKGLGQRYFRFAVKKRDDNKKFIKVLKRALQC